MSENSLAVFNNQTDVQQYNPEALKAVMGSNSYLPRLQFMSSKSEKVSDGEFPANHYALVRGQEYEDIGEEIRVIVCAYRPMAMDMSGDTPIVIYSLNPDSENQPTGAFAEIQNRADNVPQSRCMYGMVFLMWLPDHNCFATLFIGAASIRQDIPQYIALQGQPALLNRQKKSSKKYNTSWYLPRILPNERDDNTYPVPDMKLAESSARIFNELKDSEIETASESEEQATDRER